jgi:hypothetical protein
MLGVGIHRLQIIQRAGGIGQFADALVVFALTATDAAEIEPQDRKAEFVESIMQVIDDPVVHRPAELRMRVQDNGDRGVTVFLRVVTAFKPTIGAGENHFGHGRPILLVCFGPGEFLTKTLRHLRRILN